MPEDFPAPSRTPPAVDREMYLRVRESWESTPGVIQGASAGSPNGHQYIALRQGDVILQHNRYPNGWSYGQTLTTGAYGFLPANHCESFRPTELKQLLDALVQVWQSFGAHQRAGIAANIIQNNVSAMLDGVRRFLKQMQCLEGDATLVKSHPGIWKMRKSLLGDFHVFVKASSKLQELNRSQTDKTEDRQFVLVKACKVAMRAIKFLDMWNAIMDERIDVGGVLQMLDEAMTPIVEIPSALPTNLESSASEYPFPTTVRSGDQSTIHPAFRQANAEIELLQKELPQLPQSTYSARPTWPVNTLSPTKGAVAQLKSLALVDDIVDDGNANHHKTISTDLPGLAGFELRATGLLACSNDQPAGTGTQRQCMNSSTSTSTTTTSLWQARGSSLRANGRHVVFQAPSRDGQKLHRDDVPRIAEEDSTITHDAPLAPQMSIAEKDPDFDHGTTMNFSPETTPTRSRPQHDTAKFRVTPPPSLNVNRLPIPAPAPAPAVTSLPTDAATDAQEAIGQLASHKLSSAHDAFLTFLGIYIGGHLKRRSTMDLYRTTYETSLSCQTLLDVVLEIWQRDGQQSHAVDEAAQAMRSQFAELYDVTSEILKSTAEAGDDDAAAVLALPRRDEVLAEKATSCARGAGDCVVKTRAILQRLGDFDFNSSRIADDSSVVGVARAEKSTTSNVNDTGKCHDDDDDRDHVPQRKDSGLADKIITTPSQSPPKIKTTFASPRTIAAHPPAHSPPPVPPHGVTSVSPSSLLSSASFPGHTTATTVSSAGHDSQEQQRYMPVTIRTTHGLMPTLDVDFPPPLSPIDFPEPRTSFTSIHGKTYRADSVGASVTNSASTRTTFRHSNTSIVSAASTRATTPDRGHRRDVHDRALNQSFGTLMSESTCSLKDDEGAVTAAGQFQEAHAHELVLNNDGQISGGTLPALIERLTPYDSHPDSVFLNAFLLTFRLFTTPIDFAQSLVERFDALFLQPPAHARPIRLRVYNIFKQWLENHWQPETDKQVLPLVADFAHGSLQQWLASPSKRLIELLDRLRDTQYLSMGNRTISGMRRTNTAISPVNEDTAAPIITKAQLTLLRKAHEGGPACNILNFDALELARHFTLIESRIFNAIAPEELLAQEWTLKESKKALNVRAMSSLNNDFANLVTDTILQFEEPKKRALAIKQWITIARHCHDLGNFDTIFAVMGSLNNTMIRRLEKTWGLVSPKTMLIFEEFQQLTDFHKNYSELRKQLSTRASPCVPFVGMYLTDLTFTDVGNGSIRQVRHSSISVASGVTGIATAEAIATNRASATRPISLNTAVSSGGINHADFSPAGEPTLSVINFHKYMKTSRIIADLQRFQQPYALQLVPELMEWCECQLARVKANQPELLVSHDRRSKQLEPRKVEQGRESRERREKELEALRREVEGGTATSKDDVLKERDGNTSVKENTVVSAAKEKESSARGRLHWMEKMKFPSHRERSGS
jgi:hypothetical protein